MFFYCEYTLSNFIFLSMHIILLLNITNCYIVFLEKEKKKSITNMFIIIIIIFIIFKGLKKIFFISFE